MNKAFIKDLQNSSFLDVIKNKQEVVGIYLAGSRSLGLYDDYSDYDIVVITKHSLDNEEGIFALEYNDINVHWYYRSLDQIIDGYTTQNKRELSHLSGVNLHNFENNIIYINPEYQNLINFIYQYKEKICKFKCWEFILTNNTYINVLVNQKITENDRTKFLYHLCVCYYLLFEKEFDVDFLNKLKRIRTTENAEVVLAKEIGKAERIIFQLNDYYLNNNLNREETKKFLLQKLEEAQQ